MLDAIDSTFIALLIKTLLYREKDEVQAAIFLLKGSFPSSCVHDVYNIIIDFPISYAHQIRDHHLLSSLQGSEISSDTDHCLYPHSGLAS